MILCSDFRSQLLFLFYDIRHFLKKWVSYVSPSQATRWNMCANGFSSYELFIKIIDFSAPARRFVPLLVKTHFFNLIELVFLFTEALYLCLVFSMHIILLFFQKYDPQFCIKQISSFLSPDHSWTLPTNSAAPCYVESF